MVDRRVSETGNKDCVFVRSSSSKRSRAQSEAFCWKIGGQSSGSLRPVGESRASKVAGNAAVNIRELGKAGSIPLQPFFGWLAD